MYKKVMMPGVLFLVLLALVVFLLGCTKEEKVENLYKDCSFLGDKGVFCAINDLSNGLNERKNKSLMRGVVDDNSVKSFDIDCGVLSNIEENENYIYAVEEERNNKWLENNIIVFDKGKRYKYKYNLETVINDICGINDELYYVYTSHSGGNMSYITRMKNNNADNKLIKLNSNSLRNVVVGHIDVYNDKLYAFGFDYGEEGVYSKLYILDRKELNVEKEINISNYIVDVTDTCLIKNELYISGRTSREYKEDEYVEVENKSIYSFNVDTFEIREIYIGGISNTLEYDEDYLYIAGYDNVLDEGNRLYSYCLSTKVVRQWNVAEKIRDILLRNKDVYVLGERKLLQYSINYDSSKKQFMTLKNKMNLINNKEINNMEIIGFVKKVL